MSKLARTEEPADLNQAENLGRPQLLVTSPELQARIGKKFCDETELLPLMLAQSLVHHRARNKGTKRTRTRNQEDADVFDDVPVTKRRVVDGHQMATKRTQQAGVGGFTDIPGRQQLLLTNPELQTRLGQKFCDEIELLPLMLAHSLVRRVHTIQVEVRPLGGDSFKVTLDASKPTVGEAKLEIACAQGTAEPRQELYKVAMRADGLAVREDDAEPELLEDASMLLEDGEVLAMAVNDSLVWQTFAEDRVVLSEGGAVVTHNAETKWSLTTSGVVLTEGRHYWEVELLSEFVMDTYIGVSRPGLDPKCDYTNTHRGTASGWFISARFGNLCASGRVARPSTQHAAVKNSATPHKGKKGDRVGVLLDLDDGSLQFYLNDKPNSLFPAGSVTAPVTHAVNIFKSQTQVRLLPDAQRSE
jgi:hypothetical protein